MQTIRLPFTGYQTSRLIFGCMRLPGAYADARLPIHAALEAGIDFFDHADIYGGGNCETVFGNVWADGVRRDEIVLQSKCGIRPGRYDYSYEHIMSSVVASLKRLGTDYLDILLLHRPDLLMEPDEVAEAFDALQSSGKVRYFGVSNFTPALLDMLSPSLTQTLVANQIQLSLAHYDAFDSYLVKGYGEDRTPTRGEGIIEYAMTNGITIQAYGPLGGGGMMRAEAAESPVGAKLTELAGEYGVSREAIALAWLLRHPVGIMPVLGSMNPARIASAAQATDIELTREQWYELYLAARGQRLP